jgi:hypothetical protein
MAEKALVASDWVPRAAYERAETDLKVARQHIASIEQQIANTVVALDPDWEASGMNKDHLDQLAIDTIRTLSIDAVQKAKSGHPGTPMALAPLVYTIWNPGHALRSQGSDPARP